MESASIELDMLDQPARACYRDALAALGAAATPFLLGGTFAFACHTGIERYTKDLDIFVREGDLPSIRATFEQAGYTTDLPFPHWLAKAWRGEYFVDIIFNSGNGLTPVDDSWFVHATPGTVMGLAVQICPAEEMIWSKAFVQERERYDGADVAHLLLGRGPALDWSRLLARFADQWRVLLSHLILFGFSYPSERTRIPAWVLEELCARLLAECASAVPSERVCRGTLLSREQYLVDVEQLGFRDGRLGPESTMNRSAIAQWTAAIER